MPTEAEQYQERVYDFLDRLPAGVYPLTNFVKPGNEDKFLSVAKKYVDEKGRGVNGFDLDFSDDWKRLHKFDLVLTPINKIL